MKSFFLERICDKLANYLFDGHTANVEFLNIDSAVDVDVGIKTKLSVADTFDLDIRTELAEQQKYFIKLGECICIGVDDQRKGTCV